ncbi:MAG: hypothetical protein H0V96_07190 [Acidimicrobiia bacterium]|nr:hypothetical protein [Acidimicrobiia bacterium]
MRWLLGLGSLGFGVWGLASPETLARSMGVTESMARTIGFRDLASGGFLLAKGGPLAYGSRALFDFGDAFVTRNTKPKIAAAAAAFGLLSLVLTIRAIRRNRSQPDIPSELA